MLKAAVLAEAARRARLVIAGKLKARDARLLTRGYAVRVASEASA